MYYFISTEKAKVLQGRTITYLADKKLHIGKAYLTSILNGKRGCSVRLADSIAKCICWDAKITDYFTKKEKGE